MYIYICTSVATRTVVRTYVYEYCTVNVPTHAPLDPSSTFCAGVSALRAHDQQEGTERYNTGTGTGTVCRYINTVLGIIGQSTGRTLSKDGPKVKPPGSES